MSLVIGKQTTLYNYTYPYRNWEHKEWKWLGIYIITYNLHVN